MFLSSRWITSLFQRETTEREEGGAPLSLLLLCVWAGFACCLARPTNMRSRDRHSTNQFALGASGQAAEHNNAVPLRV